MISLLAVGCTSVKEFVPIHSHAAPIRVPNQQRLVSLATAQAIQNAVRDANLAQYAGQSGRVEVNGVFPHSAQDLLEYVASSVEFEMARVGMRVIAHATLPVRDEATPSGTMIIMKESAPEPTPPDLRVVVSLDWGGIDFKDHQYVVWPKAAGQLGLAIGSILIGGTIIGASLTATKTVFGREVADTDVQTAGGIAGGAILGAGVLAAIIWRLADKPVGHQFTLTGRVRLALRVIPNAAGQRPAIGTGDGESHIVIDTKSDSGYTNFIEVPETKK
jgi:hypothetical protein